MMVSQGRSKGDNSETRRIAFFFEQGLPDPPPPLHSLTSPPLVQIWQGLSNDQPPVRCNHFGFVGLSVRGLWEEFVIQKFSAIFVTCWDDHHKMPKMVCQKANGPPQNGCKLPKMKLLLVCRIVAKSRKFANIWHRWSKGVKKKAKKAKNGQNCPKWPKAAGGTSFPPAWVDREYLPPPV